MVAAYGHESWDIDIDLKTFTYPEGFSFVNLIFLRHTFFDEFAKIIESEAGADLDLILLHVLSLCLRYFFFCRGAKRMCFLSEKSFAKYHVTGKIITEFRIKIFYWAHDKITFWILIVYNKTRTSSCQRVTVKVSVCLGVRKSLLSILASGLLAGDIDSSVPGRAGGCTDSRVNKY